MRGIGVPAARVPRTALPCRSSAPYTPDRAGSRSPAPVKTAVEELTPTRVKLTIEVPFEELKPSLDKAYKSLSSQVRLKGFRPGKVPARLIDPYVGRGAVLQEAVNDALPELYGKAVEENEL